MSRSFILKKQSFNVLYCLFFQLTVVLFLYRIKKMIMRELIMNKNAKIYLLCNSLVWVSHIFAYGTVIQTYLFNIGLSSAQVSIFTLLASITQIAVNILSLFCADRVKRITPVISKCMLVTIIFFITMIVLNAFAGITETFIFTFAIIACIIYFIAYSFKGILDYRIPYVILDINQYGSYVNYSGVITNVSGLVVSIVFSFFVVRFEYIRVINICFILCMILNFTASRLVYLCKEKPQNNLKKNDFSMKIFKEPFMLLLAPAHFIRGISNGVVGMATIIFLSQVSTEVGLSSLLTFLCASGYVIACIIYLLTEKRIPVIYFTLFGGIIMGLSLTFLIMTSKVLTFFILYTLCITGMVFVDNSVPVFITKFIPQKIIGTYTSARMLLTTGGVAVGNMLIGVLTETGKLQNYAILIGIFSIISSVSFYLYDIFFVKNISEREN